MGKIRTRFIGIKEVEEKEKKAQKDKSQEKKQSKEKIKIKVPEQKEDGRELIETKEKEESKKSVKSVKSVKARTRGKKYLLAKKEIEQKLKGDLRKIGLSLKEAIELLKKIKYAKFDESVELHIKASESSIKGEVQMPYSIGKEVRVQIVDDEIINKIEKGKTDFDILISHPSYMPKLVKFAKILGPRGLMPNPKAGTVSDKPEEVAKKFKKGVLKWKSEIKQPLIHQQISKLSSQTKEIEENAKIFINSIGKSKIIEIYLTSSMSPSIKIDASKL